MNRLWTVILVVWVLASCTGTGRPPSAQITGGDSSHDFRDEGLLLLMSDRRLYDPYTLNTIRGSRPDLDVMVAHYPSRPDSGEYERYRDAGATSINVPPWSYHTSKPPRLDDIRRSMEAFAERYLIRLGS